MQKNLQRTFTIAVYVFALIGLLFVLVFIGMRFNLLNVRGSIDERNEFFATTTNYSQPCISESEKVCAWNETPEWLTVKEGLRKDSDIISRVAKETGVPARLIAGAVVPEQLRFFTSEREVYKRYFEPLKILGSLSQFSLGVSGIKQETARMVEQNLADQSSPFYTGADDAALVAYSTTDDDRASELYNRLTDAENHYYSYLYTALTLKQFMTQWEKGGYPIDEKPGVVITLFNIGFERSIPKENPQVGGAGVSVGGRSYTFGALGELFYSSGELRDVF